MKTPVCSEHGPYTKPLLCHGCVADAINDRDRYKTALKAVEAWWLESGMHSFDGAPACIFMVRAALAQLGSAPDKPAEEELRD